MLFTEHIDPKRVKPYPDGPAGRRRFRVYRSPEDKVDFAKALSYVNRVAEIADEQGHHPDIYLSWGRVHVKIWTHKIDGLTESDFILAAKIDALRRA